MHETKPVELAPDIKLEDPPASSTESDKGPELDTLLRGRRLAIVFSAFLIAFSLVALDQTILSTALPTIVSHFHAVSDLSWIASAYFLSQAGFMLFFGKVLSITSAKAVFLVSICIFELGSLFCAASPSVHFLIFGRAVAGFGASGLWVSIMTMIARFTTIAQRPILLGLFGAVYAASSIVGPLLGGVLSDHVTWRWCFYINLPVGGIAVLVTVLALPNHPPPENTEPQLRRWLGLDWIGTFLSFSTVSMLLLGLQWGGNQKPWNDPAVITSLVLFVVLLTLFILWEYRLGARAMLPLEVLTKKSIVGACLESFFLNVCFILANYYLPLFFQVKGHSATRSGIDILPFMMAGVLGLLVAGGIITALGYAWPFLLFCPLLGSVASGLLFTINADTSLSRVVGFQMILGVGVGAAIQNTVVVAQAEYPDNEALVAHATSLVSFVQLFGSSVGLAAAGAVFSSQLKRGVHEFAASLPPDVTRAILSSVKAIFILPAAQRAVVAKAYIFAVNRVFLMGVPAGALASLSALLISRRKTTTQSHGASV